MRENFLITIQESQFLKLGSRRGRRRLRGKTVCIVAKLRIKRIANIFFIIGMLILVISAIFSMDLSGGQLERTAFDLDAVVIEQSSCDLFTGGRKDPGNG